MKIVIMKRAVKIVDKDFLEVVKKLSKVSGESQEAAVNAIIHAGLLKLITTLVGNKKKAARPATIDDELDQKASDMEEEVEE